MARRVLIIAILAALMLPGCSSVQTTTAPAPPPAAETTPPVSAVPTPTVPHGTTPSTSSPAPVMPANRMTFAVIGDYGMGDEHEAAVARLVKSWGPKFVVALGDDYYAPAGGTGTGKYDRSTGAFYAEWLKDVTTTGTHRGTARVNSFFPALGNHDYSDATPSPATYLTYFRLPGRGYVNSSGNERYYDFEVGRIHFFALNSNPDEPDGITASSKQAAWLKSRLAASKAQYNVVFDHHPPYSSDNKHGSIAALQWPFAQWGADVVLSGHAHTYERVMRDGIVYFVNGLGGAVRYGFGNTVAGSASRYASGWGAQRVTVGQSEMTFEFFSADGRLIDRYSVTAP